VTRPQPYEGLLPGDILGDLEAVRTGRARVTPKRLRPRCGARTRDGRTCQAPAVWDRESDRAINGRCRMHGGTAAARQAASRA